MRSELEPMMTSKSNEWETPQWLFNEVNSHFYFDFDLAADADNAKCKEWTNDAFKKSWRKGDLGTIWCNPPYGKIDFGGKRPGGGEAFTHRAIYTQDNSLDFDAVFLLPVRIGSKWYRHAIENSIITVAFEHRLTFGGIKTNAPFGSSLSLYSSDPKIGDIEFLASIPRTHIIGGRYAHVPRRQKHE